MKLTEKKITTAIAAAAFLVMSVIASAAPVAKSAVAPTPAVATATVPATSTAAVVPTQQPVKLSAIEVLSRSVEEYRKVGAYEVNMYLMQPRTPKEAQNATLLLQLRETFRLRYIRKGAPMDSFIRLEGIYGSNHNTVAVYSPVLGRITVYRPGKKTNMKPDDKRMQDLFAVDLLSIATESLETAKDKRDVKVTLIEGSFKKTEEAKSPVSCYILTIETKDVRNTVYINRKTFLLERQEIEFANPKARSEANKFTLARRQTWFGFKALEGDAAALITEKPKFSKR